MKYVQINSNSADISAYYQLDDDGLVKSRILLRGNNSSIRVRYATYETLFSDYIEISPKIYYQALQAFIRQIKGIQYGEFRSHRDARGVTISRYHDGLLTIVYMSEVCGYAYIEAPNGYRMEGDPTTREEFSTVLSGVIRSIKE